MNNINSIRTFNNSKYGDSSLLSAFSSNRSRKDSRTKATRGVLTGSFTSSNSLEKSTVTSNSDFIKEVA